MLVSHDLSAAINILTASNDYDQIDNKEKYNLHRFVPFTFWCLWFIVTLRTAVLETWIFLPCDFYRFYCFKYVGLCNNITIKKRISDYFPVCWQPFLLQSEILKLEKSDLRRTETSTLKFSITLWAFSHLPNSQLVSSQCRGLVQESFWSVLGSGVPSSHSNLTVIINSAASNCAYSYN